MPRPPIPIPPGVVGFEERGIVAMTLAEDETCGNDIVFYDVSETPKDPQRLGCVGGDQDDWLKGGTHDAQCVVYEGPDADYNGAGEDGTLGTADDVPASDICVMFQEGAGTYVVDVSLLTRDGNASGAKMLTRFTYDTINYTHQGWFTEDQRWVIFGDEVDESGAVAQVLGGRGGQNLSNTTYWIDLEDLDIAAKMAAGPFEDVNQELVKSWSNPNTIAIDHNMYIVDDLVYQANYGAGLRVLRFSDQSLAAKDTSAAFEEVAYFDTYPGPGPSEFYGAWTPVLRVGQDHPVGLPGRPAGARRPRRGLRARRGLTTRLVRTPRAARVGRPCVHRDVIANGTGIGYEHVVAGATRDRWRQTVTQKIDKSDAEWEQELSPSQFKVLRKEGTEPAGTGRLDHEKRDGVYRCAACHAELFSSEHKYESGSGWPSFYDVFAEDNVATKKDRKLLATRTEVHCDICGGHLGHVFDDGPQPTGLRYCMNSAALEFAPEESDEVVPGAADA